MSDNRETSFDRYVSASDGGRGMFEFGGPRRCKRCEKFREKMGYDDFICRHMRGYKEAPDHIGRCVSCDDWKKSQGIKKNFWCKHNKFYKTKWDQRQGWN